MQVEENEERHLNQLDLSFDEAEVLANGSTEAADKTDITAAKTHIDPQAQEIQAKSRPRGKRSPIPADVKRVRVVIAVPEGDRVCPCCGKTMVEIGEEISEQLDIVPMTIRVLQHVRKRYGCPSREHAPIIAPRPEQVLPKSNASNDFLAMLLTVKYVDGLPLARMEKILGRSGVEVPRVTLARWVIQTAEQLKPLATAMNEVLLASPVILMDETTVQVLKEKGRDPSSKSYMWVRRGNAADKPVVLYHYEPSRSGRIPINLLEGWKGYLMTDGYSGYNQIGRVEGVELLACWAHARRGFVDAVKLQPKGKKGRADEAVRMIAELYAIEKEKRHSGIEERYPPVSG